MPLCVVVASRDRPAMLDRCLSSVVQALRFGDDLVVVDSAGRDPEAVAAVAAKHGARQLRTERPGVNHARNLGWRSGTASLVLFTDDDVEVDAQWAEGYRSSLAPHGFATGWVGARGVGGHRIAVKDDERATVLDRRSPAPLGHGASTAVRREALEAVGGWDEALGAGGRFRSAPESDLYDRLLAGGWTGAYLPSARAWHHQWRSNRQVAWLQLNYAVGTGARLSKLVRTDRARLPHAMRDALWLWGLASVGRGVLARDMTGVGAGVVRLVGYTAGFVLGFTMSVEDGHFRSRH